MNLCPCRRCRPPGQSLKAAMKACHDAAMIARYGAEEYERYKVAEKLRLAKLHEEKKREITTALQAMAGPSAHRYLRPHEGLT